jgi:hypothetical protein
VAAPGLHPCLGLIGWPCAPRLRSGAALAGLCQPVSWWAVWAVWAAPGLHPCLGLIGWPCAPRLRSGAALVGHAPPVNWWPRGAPPGLPCLSGLNLPPRGQGQGAGAGALMEKATGHKA